ncbi:MAG TPA: AsmA family protein, partial [Gammaproteobacteria bacterium]|nr:AsmA family protein [Gammaproteobacteria bacterium]
DFAKLTAPKRKPQKPKPLDLKFLRAIDAIVNIHGDKILAPKIALRDVRVALRLKEGRLRVDPFDVGVGGGTVRGKLAVDSSTPIRGSLMTGINKVDIEKIVAPFHLKSTFGVLDGRVHIAIVGATKEQIAAAVEQTPLTFIHSLVIDDTHFTYRDPDSGIDIKTRLATAKASNGAEPTTIEGHGRYQGEPFKLHIGAGSLLRLIEEKRPYPVEAQVEVAKTKASIKGEVTRPLDFKGLNLALKIKGPNPSSLNKLAGLSLPDLPPYDIKGQLSYAGKIWRFDNFVGNVGDSDMTGDVAVRTLRDPRPLLIADLKSRRLDLDELRGRAGAAPDTGPGEAESKQQKREAKTETKTATVLPRDPIDLKSLKTIDAQVSFNGKRVQTTLPIDDLRIRAKLDGGRLVLKPFNLGVGGGQIKSWFRLDASARPVQAVLKTEVRQVELKQLLRWSGFAQKSVGNIGGRARLNAIGDSVAALMATLDGRVLLAMKGGEIDSLLIELGGLDLTQALG